MTKTMVPNELFRRARIARNLTQQELADLLLVSEDTVRAWERGRRAPSLSIRRQITELFELSPADLGLEASENLDGEVEVPPFEGQASLRQGRINRRRMIRQVRSTWIDGILRQSLFRAARIELDLQDYPYALADSWQFAALEKDFPPRSFPPHTSIEEVYTQADGLLLILGEPGGGKTTLLLELVRMLLKQAELDERLPLPVVFNLSSWGTKQLPLADWLLIELETTYHVPRCLGQQWLDNNSLTFLLDGLDEVAQSEQDACVSALETYLKDPEQMSVSMVVCCRSNDYYALHTRLPLRQAVAIQPLTNEQITDYLSRGRLEAVQKALAGDAELQEMVKTPLMLGIVALVYRGKTGAALKLAGTRRQTILKTYVQSMLERRKLIRYQPDQVIRWLGWLARQMQVQGKTEFYLEQMQPDWLPDEHVYRRYRLAMIRWTLGLTALIKAGLLACFRGDSFPKQPGLFFWVGGGKGNSTLGWMAPGLGGWLQGATSMLLIYALVTILVVVLSDLKHIPTISNKAIQQGILSGLRSGFPVAATFSALAGLIYWRAGGNGILHGVSDGLFAGFIFGLQRGLVALLRYEANSSFGVQKSVLIPRRERILNGLIFGLCAFVGFTGIYVWQSWGINQLIVLYGAVVGCLFAVIYSISYGTRYELGLAIHPAETVAWSWLAVWQHLRQTLKKGVILGNTILVFVVFVVTVMSSLSYGITYGVIYGAIYGVIVGVTVGVAGILVGILTSGWSSSIIDDRRQLAKPNAGIRRSLRNAIFAACVFGPVGGVVSGLVSGLAFWASGIREWYVLGLGFAIVFTLTFALEFITVYGGLAVLGHYLLRWYLWRRKLIPWHYAAFLDSASELILLRKLGEGYMFIHRLLLDHFADKSTHTNTR